MTTINNPQLKALQTILKEYEDNDGGMNSRHGYFQTSNTHVKGNTFFDGIFFELFDVDYGNCVKRGFIHEFGEIDVTETYKPLTNDDIAERLD